MLLAILSAILGIPAFPLPGIYPLGFIFLVPLFIFFIKERKLSRLILGAFIFRLIFSTGITFFVFEPVIFLLSIFIFLGLPLSIFFSRLLIKKLKPVSASAELEDFLMLILMPFVWTFWDFLQAQFSFLPTFIITTGNIFGSSPFLGLAAFGGLTTLTLFAAAINCLIAFLILNFKKWELKKSAIFALFIVFIISAGFLISKSKLKNNKFAYQDLTAKFKAALVSNKENFDQEFRFFKNDILSPEEKALAETLMEKKLNLIKNELSGQKLDLIILPEDMIHLDSLKDSDTEAKNKFGIENAGVLIMAYRGLAQELNANLAATLNTIQNGKRYKSTILFNRQGELIDVYNKLNLTIIGEYWPFGNWRPFYYNLIKKFSQDKVGMGGAIFNKEAAFQPGQGKILRIENVIFGSAICGEIQYPWQMKTLKKMGAGFISHNTTEDWLIFGLKNLRELTNNLRKIEAVWLKIPILINGREEMAGVITPDGEIKSVNFESQNKNFGIFIGIIKAN